jgi:hypothetical protein
VPATFIFNAALESFLLNFFITIRQNELESLNLAVGNFDIDFFIFRFHIMSLKFLKFERVQNVAKKFPKFFQAAPMFEGQRPYF